MNHSNYSFPEGVYLKVVEWIISDTTLCIVLFAPIAMATVNFIFGSCVVNDIYGFMKHRPSRNSKSLYQRVGRGCVSGVLISFACQYYVYFHVAHSSWNGNVYQCSPADIGLKIFLLWGSDNCVFSDFIAIFRCRKEDVLFLILCGTFFFLYVGLVRSYPATKLGKGEEVVSIAKASSIERNVSFCRYCEADVVEMDHHCFLVDNCIGHHNRARFLSLLGVSVLELSFFVGVCSPYCFSDRPSLLCLCGILLASAALIFVMFFFLFHLFLWKKKVTTKTFVRNIYGKKGMKI